MIYFELFLTFFEIGAVSFGGGYGMISLIRELTLAKGWLSEAELLNFIAVSESTPGPIAINMATFVGTSQGGIPGALLATLGVVLPSFIIILIIAALIRNLLRYPAVQAVLQGIRPCAAGLILATGAIMFLSTLFDFRRLGEPLRISLRALVIFAVLALTAAVFKRLFRKKLSPIVLILFSAVLGMVLFSV